MLFCEGTQATFVPNGPNLFGFDMISNINAIVIDLQNVTPELEWGSAAENVKLRTIILF